MTIIDLGICIDNIDPKGLGRIRCVRYSDRVSEKERALKYEAFSDTDPFVAIPFLPYNINFIPEIDQAVKILNYNPTKENVNVEYIAGPFTTLHDFNGQSFSQQIENTTYGVPMKESPNIFDSNGNYINPKTSEAFAKKSDYAIYGKYGSDIIFTENGIQLRGGKLFSKEALSSTNREKSVKFPLMGKKNSTLYLKKFPKTMSLVDSEVKETSVEIKDVKTLVEYSIDNLSNPTQIDFYVYKITNNGGPVTKTNFFNESINLPSSVLKLINTDNSTTGATHSVVITADDKEYVNRNIRDFLYTIHEYGLNKINSLYNKEDLHPIFFRPSESFKNLSGNTQDIEYKNTTISGIKLFDVGPRSGLIFSLLSVNPPVKNKKVKKKIIKVDNSSPEQTFSALKSDKIYFLSTDTNETNKAIDFSILQKYEFDQTDYIQNIDPNTYSTVRGENLVNLLRLMVRVLFNHVHNINKPMVKVGYDEFDQLVDLLKNMENDLLNKSIRIN